MIWRIALCIACNYLLWLIAAQANHYLALWHVSLFAGGLMVTYPALRLPYREGVAVVFLTGLLLDAGTPVPFGLHAFLMLFAHAVVLGARNRLSREENAVALVVALATNLGLVLAISLVFLVRGRLAAGIWPRILFDLLASEVLVAVVTPWFLALQQRALEIGGVHLRREQGGME